MAASTILIRCVDPRFEGEWAPTIQKAIGPHYSLTEFGGFDTLGEEGFQQLARKISAIRKMNSAVHRIIVTFHTDCAWCGALRMNDEEQRTRAFALARQIAYLFVPVEVFVGKVEEGWITLLNS